MWIREQYGNKVYHRYSMSWVFHHIHVRRTGVWSGSPAGSFLHPLVAIQDAFKKLCHEGFEVGVRGLGDHPMCITTKGPAGDGAHQGLLVTQTLDEVGDKLRQIGHHALHAAWGEEQMRQWQGERINVVLGFMVSLCIYYYGALCNVSFQ